MIMLSRLLLLSLLALSCTDTFMAYKGPIQEVPVVSINTRIMPNSQLQARFTTTRFLEIANPSMTEMEVNVSCSTFMVDSVIIPARTSTQLMVSGQAESCSVELVR